MLSGTARLTSGTMILHGGFGQPIVSGTLSGASTKLSSGYYAGLEGLLTVNIPPTISFTASSITAGVPKTIEATITDRDGVQSVSLSYRAIGNEAFTTITSLQKDGDKYSASIPVTGYDAVGLELFFTAVDATGKESRSPVSGSHYLYTVNASPLIPPSNFSFGDKQENYRIISMPYNYPNNISALFNEITDPTDFRLFKFQGNNTWIEFPAFTTFDRGVGYWIIIRSSTDISLPQNPPLSNNQSALFSTTLKPGWNQIGNPYPVAISWANVRNFNGNANIGPLKLFKGSWGNETSAGWQPFEGGFVFVEGTTDVVIDIPFRDQLSGGRIQGDEFATDITQPAWKLNLVVEQDNRVNSLGAIGMHPSALIGKDYFDDHNPPRFNDFPEINFPHPEHVLGAFCVDIVPTQEKFVWNFVIDADADRPVRLTWNNSDLGNTREIDLYLFDEQSNRLVNMQTANHYTQSKPGHLSIYYGRDIDAEITAPSVSLGSVYPNPLATPHQNFTIPFTLPESVNSFPVTLEIIDTHGKRVKTLLSSTLAPGFYEVEWNGNDERNINCASGLYFCRLHVETTGGLLVRSQRLMIIR